MEYYTVCHVSCEPQFTGVGRGDAIFISSSVILDYNNKTV